MTHNLQPDLLLRARQILLPLVTTEEERDALLTEAFYLYDPLLYKIDRQGAAYPFAINCVKRLLDYGCLTDQEHSLARLLTIARSLCDVEKHPEIDDLTRIANAICQAKQDRTRPPVPLTPPVVAAPLQTIATPHAERHPTVFLSYAHADAEFANRLIADLREAGHACWIDISELKGGDEWIMAIAEGITNSYVMVVVVTRQALESRWVQDEILWARKKNKPIIPVMLEDAFGETRFFPLASYQAVAFFDQPYAAVFPKLFQSLPSPTLPKIKGENVSAALDLPESPPSPVNQNTQFISVPRVLELDYLERLNLEELLNTEKYTPLAGSSQRSVHKTEMRAVFELLLMGKEQEQVQERRRFENAVAEILHLRRAVLLGEPGGGKTTTIWKLAAELAAKVLADRAAPIPLLIRLGRWTEAEQGLPEFIATQLGDLGAYLKVLLGERRAALLLDGLNELPASQRADKYPQVQRLIKQYPHLLAVVSCRELDYTVDLEFDRINITPLDPLRIREFVKRYLGETKGEEMFWKLAGRVAKDTHGEFMRQLGGKMDDPERVFWIDADLPEDVADAAWGWNYYWQRWVRNREIPSSLMALARNPYMLLMLTSVYAEQGKLPENRGELFQLFVQMLLEREHIPTEEQAALTDGLMGVAFEMQTRRSGDEEGGALTVLHKTEIGNLLDERMLYLAGSASILSVGEQVHFTHQLLQEYFAAKYLDSGIKTGYLSATTIWKPDRWWESTNWEEAAILLAGLYGSDCSIVMDWLADANPVLAAQCINRSGANIPDATRARLRDRWLPRLNDLDREPRVHARAAVGLALGHIGLDNRRGVGVIRSRHGVALPDINFIEIPGGAFQYGQANDDHAAEPQRLILSTFYISRYPITYAQFQTFLDDPAGYADPHWFEGLAADENDRRMDEQYFKFTNHPRDTVNWYQAIAFCRWLSWRWSGGYEVQRVNEWAVRLPTEFEWEKAARGTDGRLFPYGNEFDAEKSNTGETGIYQTTAVGIFPNGASPYSVEEMSGNVWEWCLTNHDNPQFEPQKEKLGDDENRLLRGGSWSFDDVSARAVYRDSFAPGGRSDLLGFRVVAVSPNPLTHLL
jgi:formylglycine-generating enzyme required for sulfatase activity